MLLIAVIIAGAISVFAELCLSGPLLLLQAELASDRGDDRKGGGRRRRHLMRHPLIVVAGYWHW